MTKRAVSIAAVALTIMPAVILQAFQYGQRQRQSQGYEWEMQDAIADPVDVDEIGEFNFGRLRFSNFRGGGFGGGGRRGGGAKWAVDSNRGDRLFIMAARRLMRLHSRSVETVINIPDETLFDHPWMMGTEVGSWDISESEGKRFRQYFDRGGFLMVDDFHGTYEWEVFLLGLQRIFPDRPVVDIPPNDAIFHMLNDLDDKFQVPGRQVMGSGRTYEQDGYEPKWRGIYDDKGRLQVAICHNMDLGDAWQWADDPRYPEKYSSLAFRIGTNYIAYAMTH